MAEELTVEIRQTRGKNNARRLRRAGHVPAVLYGHQQETVCLSVPSGPLDAAVRHGSRVVTLRGEVDEQAFIRELQWDAWGTHVMHVDFTRVSADETVEVEVTLELRGEAPGVKEGGVVEQLLHQVQLQCKVTDVPEKINININQLKLGESITLSQLDIPAGSKIEGDPEMSIVHCVQPLEEPEEEAVEGDEGEPELIGGHKEDKPENE